MSSSPHHHPTHPVETLNARIDRRYARSTLLIVLRDQLVRGIANLKISRMSSTATTSRPCIVYASRKRSQPRSKPGRLMFLRSLAHSEGVIARFH